MTSVSVRIAAANGDGVESSGAILGRVAANLGLEVVGDRGYQSVIRGGHVWSQVRIGDEKLHDFGDSADILVALNQEAIAHQGSHLGRGATVIYDPSKTNADSLNGRGYRLIGMPLMDMALAAGGDPKMRNMAALGAVAKILGMPMESFEGVIKRMFSRKGNDIIANNTRAVTEGYGYSGIEKLYDLKYDGKQRYLLEGNVSLAIGAYAAGCKYYAAYPMTPASGILHWFAAHADRGVMYKQTEDEIAAINSAIGAASAGVRAMCGTSGGGFSLMVEALGMAGMIEAPIVVVESQRTGPSTGLPTKTEQGDLLFVMHASQGEFPRIVVAPRGVEECFGIAAEAFNLAERYQCPVIILMDLFLSEHFESVSGIDPGTIKIDRGKMVARASQEGRFKRYLLTDDGISPRSLPGSKGLAFIASSDEHNEYGDIVSDVLAGIDEHVEMRKRMHEKRMRKIETMLKNETLFVPSIEGEGSEHFIVTFGSTTAAARGAVERLRRMGKSFGLISFSYLMPMDSAKTKTALSGKHLIDVECNFTGQLAKVIAMNTGIMIEDKVLKYDGEAITSGEIVDRVLKVLER